MAHFAKISASNEVLQVLTLDNKDCENSEGVETESVGQAYLETHNNWPANLWIQTSYWTLNNTHLNGGTAFRGNYAGIGYTWDSTNEIFWPEKPYASWTKNISTASWEAPITYPTITDDEATPQVWVWNIIWNETAYQDDNTKGWKGNKENINGTIHSDTAIYDWNGTTWVAE